MITSIPDNCIIIDYQIILVPLHHDMRRIPIYKFYKHKYGDELLVDIVDYDMMREPLERTPICSYTFYAITLVLEADETLAVNGQSRRLSRGDIVCAIPGEVWTFPNDIKMQALNLVFEKEFLLSFFSDPHFLERFHYLQADRSSPFLRPDKETFERILGLYRQMQTEITDYDVKDQHILRAMLYETLMLLQRVPMVMPKRMESVQRSPTDVPVSRYVDDFVSSVSSHFREEHSTEYYAERLCITSNYLNKITKRVLGISAKAYIQQQCMEEACRQLQYTSLSVQEIARELGYESATYFVRAFGKCMGMTPLSYRNAKTKRPEK
mgnify:FL=1